MKVVQLAQYASRDTLAVLKCLIAKAAAGEIAGMAICFRRSDGTEDSCFTGAYKARPGDAVNAAMRLSWKLTQAQDELTGPP